MASIQGSYGLCCLLISTPGIDLDAAPPDGVGATALHMASVADDARLCTALLAGGAEPEARDAEGRSPLHRAARNGALAATGALLAGGAAPDARSTGVRCKTPPLASPQSHNNAQNLGQLTLNLATCHVSASGRP